MLSSWPFVGQLRPALRQLCIWTICSQEVSPEPQHCFEEHCSGSNIGHALVRAHIYDKVGIAFVEGHPTSLKANELRGSTSRIVICSELVG